MKVHCIMLDKILLILFFSTHRTDVVLMIYIILKNEPLTGHDSAPYLLPPRAAWLSCSDMTHKHSQMS